MTDKHEERHRKVSERAYAIWEEEGRPGGRHDQHWHDAARDVDASTVETPAPKAKAAPRKYTKKASAVAAPAPAAEPAPAPAPAASAKPAPAASAKAPAVSETPTAAAKPPVKATRAPRTVKPKKP
ncbi:DUF2934 domain-containing protein [Sphingomonas nostoxanthinifaciens]|uniref:DUF2934 domain-containing protein n=1 Tax=Sphingomonas nostoxanthinifaciens TaxID=2872652 RepID=UPI001CC21343|nr:DUF2934 domain-containing protein [Sphingomonas nostoxanthinifaciens]UAK23305.1 DUF2934 domain-containing protein [Sphingomonas nostoxanthinifaciens]